MASPHIESSRNFGSFMCLRGLTHILVNQLGTAGEPEIIGRTAAESAAATQAEKQVACYSAPEIGHIDSTNELCVLPVPETRKLPQSRCA